MIPNNVLTSKCQKQISIQANAMSKQNDMVSLRIKRSQIGPVETSETCRHALDHAQRVCHYILQHSVS
jgi:hypothetical protein